MEKIKFKDHHSKRHRHWQWHPQYDLQHLAKPFSLYINSCLLFWLTFVTRSSHLHLSHFRFLVTWSSELPFVLSHLPFPSSSFFRHSVLKSHFPFLFLLSHLSFSSSSSFRHSILKSHFPLLSLLSHLRLPCALSSHDLRIFPSTAINSLVLCCLFS